MPTLTKHQSAVIYLKGRSSENPIEVQENCQQIKTSNGSKIIKPKAAHKNMITENEGKDTKQVNNFPHKKDKLPIDKACGKGARNAQEPSPKRRGEFKPSSKMIKIS